MNLCFSQIEKFPLPKKKYIPDKIYVVHNPR